MQHTNRILHKLNESKHSFKCIFRNLDLRCMQTFWFHYITDGAIMRSIFSLNKGTSMVAIKKNQNIFRFLSIISRYEKFCRHDFSFTLKTTILSVEM